MPPELDVKLKLDIPGVLRQAGIESDKVLGEIAHKTVKYSVVEGPYAPARMARRKPKTRVPKIMRRGKSKVTHKSKGRDLPPVTGNLRRSIKAKRVFTGLWQVATETGYGGYVEFGTKRSKPYAFLKPGLEKAIKEIK